ncbi:hypothetical protein F3Y22_tig00110505pilonHSYRG00037 [Hibiscus syriacus]|uniref:RNase H type-1 domain-containing protein n=1 Tax=Hibiscus syriacus TaxID=106335 RepID=A0A6A3AEZ2_HIBSY|nr:hypothetical protein F3Y22_tig00110505pilonHSYRG00037 [Hibiscus syriacus]
MSPKRNSCDQLAYSIIFEHFLGFIRVNGVELLGAISSGIDQYTVSATRVIVEEPSAIVDVTMNDDPSGISGVVFLDLGHGVLDALSMLKNHMVCQAKPTILYHVSELLQRAWVVKFEHVGRDGNSVADGLGKLANVGDLQCVSLDAPPLSVLHALQKDGQYLTKRKRGKQERFVAGLFKRRPPLETPWSDGLLMGRGESS